MKKISMLIIILFLPACQVSQNCRSLNNSPNIEVDELYFNNLCETLINWMQHSKDLILEGVDVNEAIKQLSIFKYKDAHYYNNEISFDAWTYNIISHDLIGNYIINSTDLPYIVIIKLKYEKKHIIITSITSGIFHISWGVDY